MMSAPHSRSTRRLGCLTAASLLALAWLVAPGCSPPATPAAPPAIEISLDTPAAAAHSALRAMQAILIAQQAREPGAALAGYDKLRATLAERDIIARFDGRNARFRTLLGSDDLITGVMKNWIAAVAYYVRGTDFKQTESEPVRTNLEPGREPQRVWVRVLAHGQDDDAWIRLLCLRGDDSLWRVSRVDFWTPRKSESSAVPRAGQVSTAPASRPAQHP